MWPPLGHHVPRSPSLSPFVRLFVLNFLFWFGFNGTALIPAHLVALGASQTYIGLYNILGVLLVVIVVVFFGRPLVRLPRVKALRWGFVLLIVSSVLAYAFASSLWLLGMFRLTAAVSQVFVSTLMLSVLLDLTPPEGRAGGIALYSVAGMVTNPLSSLASEAVLRLWGGPALFLLPAVIGLATLAWSSLIREPEGRLPETPPTFWAAALRPDLRVLLVLAFVFGIYYSALMSFLPTHTQTTLGEPNLSAFLIPFSLVSIGVRVLFGSRLDEHPPRRFLWLSFLAVTLSQALLLLPASWVWIALAGFTYGLGHSVLFPLLNALVVEVGGEEQKAVYSNVFLAANLLGAVLMTPLLGVVGDFWGFPAIVAVLAVLAFLSVLLVRKTFPRARREAGPPSARSS